jgi:hypothetical protein
MVDGLYHEGFSSVEALGLLFFCTFIEARQGG